MAERVVTTPSKKDGARFKIWTASRDAQGGFMVTPKASIMAGNKKNFISCDDSGIYISGGGSVAFNTTAENIRMGGLFVQMNDFVRMLPSTIVSPIPPQIPFPPLALPMAIIRELPFFLGLLL